MQPQKSPETLRYQDMRIKFTTRGGRRHVLVYNPIKTGVATRVHTSCNKRELDQVRRRAQRLEVDGDIPAVVRVSVSVSKRTNKRPVTRSKVD
jgi:hypothetical protein